MKNAAVKHHNILRLDYELRRFFKGFLFLLATLVAHCWYTHWKLSSCTIRMLQQYYVASAVSAPEKPSETHILNARLYILDTSCIIIQFFEAKTLLTQLETIVCNVVSLSLYSIVFCRDSEYVSHFGWPLSSITTICRDFRKKTNDKPIRN